MDLEHSHDHAPTLCYHQYLEIRWSTFVARILLVNPPVLAVDLIQFDLYAEAYPYGLLQIGGYLKNQGHEVELIDMMGYDVNVDANLEDFSEASLTPHDRLRAGNDEVIGVELDVYWYGMPLDAFESRLRALGRFDEVWVTCTLNFNRSPAIETLKLVRKVLPESKIRFGGAYPTCLPDDAAHSCADEIVQGRIHEADRTLPDFDLVEGDLEVGLFRLSNGCDKNCSFCVNSRADKQIFFPIPEVRDYLTQCHEKYGIRTFSNWDPNIMLFPDLLEEFLDVAAAESWDFAFKFEMGVQPRDLPGHWLGKMKAAGVECMTIPVESVDHITLRQMRKHYTGLSSLRALRQAAELGFNVSKFHCTFIIGLPYDNLRLIFRMYHAIKRLGGLPCPFPITVVPGSLEHDRYRDVIKGKSQAELNGHLWPLLSKPQDIATYRNLLNVLYLPPKSSRVAGHLASLPSELQDMFHQEGQLSADFVAACLDSSLDTHSELERINRMVDERRTHPANRLGVKRSFPRPWCHLCSERERCERSGHCRTEYPHCRSSLTGTDLEATKDHFTWLTDRQGGGSPAVERVVDLVVKQLGRDRSRFSETLEPSMSWSPKGWQLFRFSYAFPSFRSEMDEVARTVEDMCAPFGDGPVAIARRVLRVARDRCVEQPIFGLAFDDPDAWRLKLYLQFHDGARDRPLRLVQKLTQSPDLRPLFPRRSLHLVGLDVSPRGMSAVKLYFLDPSVSITEPKSPLASVELLQHLAATGVERLVNLLTIHRMAGPGDPNLAQPVEIDFALAENELQYTDLEGSVTFQRAEAEEAPLSQLSERFGIAPRRVSVPFGEPNKLNVYYVLTKLG